MRKYSDLQSLISQNSEARQYYDGLPEYIREMVNDRRQEVNSFDSLKSHADNLLTGD